jgi:hypothetical protein
MVLDGCWCRLPERVDWAGVWASCIAQSSFAHPPPPFFFFPSSFIRFSINTASAQYFLAPSPTPCSSAISKPIRAALNVDELRYWPPRACEGQAGTLLPAERQVPRRIILLSTCFYLPTRCMLARRHLSSLAVPFMSEGKPILCVRFTSPAYTYSFDRSCDRYPASRSVSPQQERSSTHPQHFVPTCDGF